MIRSINFYLIFVIYIFWGCTSLPPEDIKYLQIKTAIRQFINKNRKANSYQIAAFAYKEKTLMGKITKLKDGRVLIGEWEISALEEKGQYKAFICKSYKDKKSNYFETHSLLLILKVDKHKKFQVISSYPLKRWGFSKRKNE